jgi:hypothetical protein
MRATPSLEDLRETLSAAGAAHHDYESGYLDGERDEQWAGFYAAYVLGRLGDFASATVLTRWLQDIPAGDDWVAAAASHVLRQLD